MYFMPVQILSLILTSFRPHYDPTLVPFHPTLVRHLRPNSDHLQQLPLAPTLQDKLRTQTFRKGATHKLKPSPSDITTIRLSNSVIGPRDHCVTDTRIPHLVEFSCPCELQVLALSKTSLYTPLGTCSNRHSCVYGHIFGYGYCLHRQSDDWTAPFCSASTQSCLQMQFCIWLWEQIVGNASETNRFRKLWVS